MKKKLFFTFVLLIIWSPIASYGDYYKLLMSKSDKVCKHMVSILNEDLKVYGKERYDKHPEFKAINWTSGGFDLIHESGEGQGERFPVIGTFSRFDIDNDAEVETVFKYGTSVNNEYTDELYVFENNIDFQKKVAFTSENFKKIKGIKFSFDFPYRIDASLIAQKEIPKYFEKSSWLEYFSLNPFVIDKIYYISIAQKSYGPRFSGNVAYEGRPLQWPLWIIIAKYTGDQKNVGKEHRAMAGLEHICYLNKITLR